MFKTLSAATLSITIALTSITATPAQAGSDDVAKVLGGLTLLYILSQAVEAETKPHYTRPQHVKPSKPSHTKPHKPRHKRLISGCYQEFKRLNGRTVKGYGARCMQNNVKRPGSLPPQCLRKVNTVNGKRTLYRNKCMRQNGWTRG